MGEKQKGRANAPTDEQIRLAKLTLEGSTNDENLNIQKLVKKVIETTRCTQSQAEVALLDNDNDVERAVLFILDNNGHVQSWTEQKNKKTKKAEAEEEVYVAPPPRRSAARGGRGTSAPRGPTREVRAEREQPVSRGNRGSSVGGAPRGRGGRAGFSRTNPHRYTVQPVGKTIDEETDWKSGPLVFQPSSTTSFSSTPAAPGAFSFAAVAAQANRRVEASPPAPPSPSKDDVPEKVVEEEEEEVIEPEADGAPPPPEPSPAPTPTPSPAPEPTVSVEQSWATELKDSLGIGRYDPPTQRVEFVGAAASTALPEYHFGFSTEAVSSAPELPAPAPVHVQPASTYHRSPDDIVQPSLQPELSMKSSSSPYATASRTLSYADTSTVNYAPTETRTVNRPPQPQQQQPQQQAAPPPQMFPPQMPYGTYPYMNMYSPVGGLRDDNPYAAALMQYPFGVGQIDLTNILTASSLSSQTTAPTPRTDHADMGKYGQARNDNVAPPPGFANQFMGQPSLSNLLLQQQHYPSHPFASFMMPPVSGRYEEDRREKRGADRQTHAQATPPPHYNGYQNNMKKTSYPTNQWANN